MVDYGTCHGNHTPINQQTHKNQLIWFDYVDAYLSLLFNPKTVTCFEKVGEEWVHPKYFSSNLHQVVPHSHLQLKFTS